MWDHSAIQKSLWSLGIPSSNWVELLPEIYDFYTHYTQQLNLSKLLSWDDFIVKHILDSASIFPILNQIEHPHILDLGTGGGFPGIVLHFLFPEATLHLVDVVEKKVDYLRKFAEHFHLPLKIWNASKESTPTVPVIVSRALGSLLYVSQQAQKKLSPKGYLLLYKGRRSQVDIEVEEFQQHSSPLILRDIIPVEVPSLEAERNIILCQKENSRPRRPRPHSHPRRGRKEYK